MHPGGDGEAEASSKVQRDCCADAGSVWFRGRVGFHVLAYVEALCMSLLNKSPAGRRTGSVKQLHQVQIGEIKIHVAVEQAHGTSN